MSEGILDQISLGKETELGTAVVPNLSIAVLPCDGVVTEQDAVGVEAIDTSPALNKDFVEGIREFNGSFEMNAYPQALGYILESALGNSDSELVGSETAVYKHTFTEKVTKPSYTLEQKIGSIVERFAGFTVSKFGLELKVGEPLKLTFEGKALSKSDANAITASYETSKVFDWTDIASITLGGVDIKCALESLSLEYNNNLQNFHGLCGEADPSQLYVEPSELEGSLNAYLTDEIKDLRTAFDAKTAQELVITIIADETIGNASNNTLVITLPKVVLNTYVHPIDTSYVAVESDFVGASDPTNGQIKVELTNLVASY
jgi:hypothetical protein